MSQNRPTLGDIEETRDRPELVKKRARVMLVESAYKWFVAICVAVLFSLLAYDIVVGVQAREEIVDCTTPGGECYQEGQERTGKFLEVLAGQGIDRETITRQIIVLAASCAGDESNRTAQDIEKCVNERLDKQHRVDLPPTAGPGN